MRVDAVVISGSCPELALAYCTPLAWAAVSANRGVHFARRPAAGAALSRA